MTDAKAEVQAAGGVLWRPGPRATVEVVVVHRPRYDDWSLPKGKLDRGETHEQGAVREVLEETGFEARLGREVARVDYVDNKGRTKTVRYWEMSATGGSFAPNAEVDELRWLPVAEARRLLSYERDRLVLDAFAARRGFVAGS